MSCAYLYVHNFPRTRVSRIWGRGLRGRRGNLAFDKETAEATRKALSGRGLAAKPCFNRRDRQERRERREWGERRNNAAPTPTPKARGKRGRRGRLREGSFEGTGTPRGSNVKQGPQRGSNGEHGESGKPKAVLGSSEFDNTYLPPSPVRIKYCVPGTPQVSGEVRNLFLLAFVFAFEPFGRGVFIGGASNSTGISF